MIQYFSVSGPVNFHNRVYYFIGRRTGVLDSTYKLITWYVLRLLFYSLQHYSFLFNIILLSLLIEHLASCSSPTFPICSSFTPNLLFRRSFHSRFFFLLSTIVSFYFPADDFSLSSFHYRRFVILVYFIVFFSDAIGFTISFHQSFHTTILS